LISSELFPFYFLNMLCHNCGQQNENGANFCRFCGTKFAQQQPLSNNQPDYSAQRQPYSWKTDEFQVAQNNERHTRQFAPQEIPQVQPIPQFQQQTLTYQPPRPLMNNYRCYRCGTNHPPVIQRQISTAGWITFAVLLVTTGVLFWIGLLIKENVTICPVCNFKTI
jgi:RNA polymerase subunit RPABC4/transcription elongation factor Spt4